MLPDAPTQGRPDRQRFPAHAFPPPAEEEKLSKLNPTAYSLLGFLHEGPKSGWDLSELAQTTIGNFWNVTRSQIYRELRTLEEQRCVKGGKPGLREKREFTITAAGREMFAEWISQEPGPELFRFPLLLTVWFAEHLHEDELEWFCRLHQTRHERQLKAYEEIFEALPKDNARAHVLRFGILYERAVMEWFDTLPWLESGKTGQRGSVRPAASARASQAGGRRRKDR